MQKINLPSEYNIVSALAPATDAAGRTGSYISLKNAVRAWLVVHIAQGNAATVAVSLSKATAVAGTGATAVTEPLSLWVTQDVSATPQPAATTAAASFTTSAALATKQIVFEVDPGSLGATFDCVAPVTGASNAANVTAAHWIVLNQYAQAAPPSVRVD
jgi:hypothetical protein